MNDLMRILVAEDEPSMQRLLRHNLQRAGFTVVLAADGSEARDMLQRDAEFGVICSDVMMSGLDGVELCAWTKQQPHLATIPFVLLSSRAQQGDLEAGLEAGADVYLTKPFDVEELIRVLTSLCGRDR